MNEDEIISSFQELMDEYPLVNILCNIQYLTKKYDNESTIWTFRDSLEDCYKAKRPIGYTYRVDFKTSLYDDESREKIKDIIEFCMIRVGGKRISKTNRYSIQSLSGDLFIYTKFENLYQDN